VSLASLNSVSPLYPVLKNIYPLPSDYVLQPPSSTHLPPFPTLFSFLYRGVTVSPFITQLGSCHWWKLTREENLWDRLAGISISCTALAAAKTFLCAPTISLSVRDGSSINRNSYFNIYHATNEVTRSETAGYLLWTYFSLGNESKE